MDESLPKNRKTREIIRPELFQAGFDEEEQPWKNVTGQGGSERRETNGET